MSKQQSSKTILMIDDDKLFCMAVEKFFSKKDIHVLTAHCGADGLKLCKQNRAEVILLDQNLPDSQGIDLCQPLLETRDQAKIIFITAFPSFDHAVDALRNGAYDYLSKPIELAELELAIQKAFRTAELEKLEQITQFHNSKKSTQNLPIGFDGGLRHIKNLVDLASSNHVPVLITGETGTGKNVVAKAIHYRQKNQNRPFVSTNCATLPENLIEAELFGHEKGSFTGADATKKGLFEMADGGTLFLDEIGEIPIHLQSKLLGALDDGTVKRLGGDTARQVDVRIIAATNVNLEEAISVKTFREDLYYRLSVLRIHLPPLRERVEDIGPLCEHFMRNRAPDQQLRISNNEIACLGKYDWPGNIRELKNIVERAIILRSGQEIHPSNFLSPQTPPANTPLQQPASNESAIETIPDIIPLADLEKHYIARALKFYDNNHTQTAKALGVARSTLIRKIDLYRLKTGDSF